MPQINTRLPNKRKLIISAFKPKIGNLKLELRGSNSVLFLGLHSSFKDFVFRVQFDDVIRCAKKAHKT